MNYINTYSQDYYMNPTYMNEINSDSESDCTPPELISGSDDDLEQSIQNEPITQSTNNNNNNSENIMTTYNEFIPTLYERLQEYASRIPPLHYAQPSATISDNMNDEMPPLEPITPTPEPSPILERLQPVQILLMNALQQQMLQDEEAQYQQDIEDAIQQSMNHSQPSVKRVVQDTVFSSFRQISYSESVGQILGYTQCPINMDEFEEGELIIQLPCEHCFSYNAIHKWLHTESASCPVCREELEYKEVVVHSNTNIDNTDDNEYDDVGHLVEFDSQEDETDCETESEY